MNDYIRKKTVKKFLKFIDLEKSTKLEFALYNFSNNYAIDNDTVFLLEQIYNTKTDEIINLLSNNNLIFIKLINDNKIKYDDIIIMKPEELNSKLFESIKQKQLLEEETKNKKEGSKIYKCNKCKKKNCEVYFKQIRSSDEPPSTIVKCLECGNTIIID